METDVFEYFAGVWSEFWFSALSFWEVFFTLILYLGVSGSFLKVVVGYFVGIRCEFVTPPTLHSCHTASKTQPSGFLGKWISALKNCIQNPVSCTMWSCSILISRIVTLKIWLRAQMIYEEKKTAAATSGRRKVFRRPGFLAAQILTLRCHPFKTTFSIFVQATFQVYHISTLF